MNECLVALAIFFVGMLTGGWCSTGFTRFVMRRNRELENENADLKDNIENGADN